MDTRFDLTVIGGGPGGYTAAIAAAKSGMKTAIIEKENILGGTCLRVGCIPSKALLESSYKYHEAKHNLSDFGVSIENAGFDLQSILDRKQNIVSDLSSGIDLLMKQNRIQKIMGTAIVTGPKSVSVKLSEDSSEVVLESDKVLLAAGSVPVELPFARFDSEVIVGSTEALSFDKVPERLVVIGGGAIGLELGSVWSRLGSKVTVIEMLDRIAPLSDKMISQMLTRTLKKQGLDILVKTALKAVQVDNSKATLTIENKKGKEEVIKCDKLLIAVGRRAASQELGLEECGIDTDRGGRVIVDDRFQTSIKDIYAIGDLIAGPMLAHKAEYDSELAVKAMQDNTGNINTDYNSVPSVIYTHPEVAQVGLTEEQAKAEGIAIKTSKAFYKSNGRAKSMGETEGVIKLIAEADTGKLLGGHIFGAGASDLIAELVMVKRLGLGAHELHKSVHGHPTLSEIVKDAAMGFI